MDGRFVPMLTVGPPFIKAVKTAMLKDVHLMVREPLASLGDYVAAGADIITIHPDACVHPHRVLQVLGATAHARPRGPDCRPRRRAESRGAGRRARPVPGRHRDGDAGRHQSRMGRAGVHPGHARPHRGGPAEDRCSSGRDILIAVDGGITRRNVGQFAGRGVDIVVTGSAVFDGDAERRTSTR